MKKCSGNNEQASERKQFSAKFIGFIPYRFAAKCPGGSYSDKPVSFYMLANNADVKEKQAYADRKKHIWIYFYAEISQQDKIFFKKLVNLGKFSAILSVGKPTPTSFLMAHSRRFSWGGIYYLLPVGRMRNV